MFDLLDAPGESIPLPSGETTRRTGLLVIVGLVVVVLGVLWGVARTGSPERDRLASEPPADVSESESVSEEGSPLTTTSDVSTTRNADTPAARIEGFVNGAPGPVIGEGVRGTVVQIAGRTMQRIDLHTGAVETLDLDQSVVWQGPDSAAMVADWHVSTTHQGGLLFTNIVDGSQRAAPVIQSSFGTRIVGAGDDSVWLASWPGASDPLAIEITLDGSIGREIELSPSFWLQGARGDQLLLQSVDGSWFYDAATGEAVRSPDTILAIGPELLLTSSCYPDLTCEVFADHGTGPRVVKGFDTFSSFGSMPFVSPDGTQALLQTFHERGPESSIVDLRTGETVDLGSLRLEPYLGFVWITDAPWFIGRDQTSRNHLVAVNTETGGQVEIDLDQGRGESHLAYVPADDAR
ncbi:MAG: hypothetical protein ACR2P0_03255 [Acidimicrobiales bacterium]